MRSPLKYKPGGLHQEHGALTADEAASVSFLNPDSRMCGASTDGSAPPRATRRRDRYEKTVPNQRHMCSMHVSSEDLWHCV